MARIAPLPCAALLACLVGLPAAAATPAAPTVPAASPVPFVAGGWRVDCAANDQKTLDCQATQQIVSNTTGQVLLAVAVRVPAGAKKSLLLLTLPLGIFVETPVKVTVDDGKAASYPIQTCTQAGCFAGDDLTEAQLGSLRSGTLLHIAYANLNKQIVTVTLPLSGFAAAYDKIVK